MQLVNGQITEFEDILAPDKKFKRKDVKEGRWRKLYGVWDPDWKLEDKEQVLTAWEADNSGEHTFSGSISTTLKDTNGNTVSGSISYQVKVVTQNLPLKQMKIDRQSYFQSAHHDQNCGFVMYDDKGSYYDTDFLPAGHSWPVYECLGMFGWTWPYHTY